MKPLYHIGIDPGTKTGIAIWDCTSKTLTAVSTCSILLAIFNVADLSKKSNGKILVRIEDPNLRKWFGNSGREKLQGAGSIKRDFSIWMEFFEIYNIPFEAVAPKNLRTKLTATTFKQITGYTARTSNHARDAAMMVFQS